jgi:hypothetical protein
MVCYVYKIIFADGKWYYGIRSLNGKASHSDGYYGSPVTNKSHWVVPHSKIVLKEFNDWGQAATYEASLIKPDLNNPNCLNECANLTFSYEVNKKAREKAVRLLKGKPLSDRHKQNISLSQKGRKVSEEVASRLRVATLGMSWWNNGQQELFSKEKPDGEWQRGRLKGCFGDSTRNIGWRWYHREGERKMFKEHPGEDWKEGRNSSWGTPTNKGMRWYHRDGVRKMFTEDPGEGWILGTPEDSYLGNPGNKGKKWYNNGLQNRMFADPPEGWMPGQLKRA